MTHPLDGASQRLTRADIHLTEADELMRAWEQGCIDRVFRQDDGNYRFNGFPDVPLMLPVIVGDVTHNLRAALDYLVYELSIWDSYGLIENGTQFPIEGSSGDDPIKTKPRFDRRRESYLKGLNARHASMIEALQPYNGVEWTETLRDISNRDKHRHLSVLTKEGRQVACLLQWHPEGKFEGPHRFDPESISVTVERFDIKLDGQYTIAITLPKRGEIALMPALRHLEAEVCRTLELFKPEF